MSVIPRIMLLGVLGAASGSAGLIFEHYWSFLTWLVSFAEEAFGCLPNSWTLLLFVLTDVSNFLSAFSRERQYPAPRSDLYFELLLVL
jgi:hypothetical protein